MKFLKAIDMVTNKIINLGDPTSNQDAATKKYVDDKFVLPSWVAPTLLASWVNYGGTFATVGYMKDSLGFVHLKGAIKNGTTAAGTVMFNLPAGFRPAEDNYYPGSAGTGGGAGTFQIMPNGNVVAVSVASGFFSFGQTVFKAEA